MKCCYFPNKEKNDEQIKTIRSNSVPCSISTSTSTTKRPGSEFSSQNFFDSSGASSSNQNWFAELSQRHTNLRVFTLEELKIATKNFSRSLMIGEGGFGGVFRATIQSKDNPRKKIEIAVKQLSRRGLQGHKEWETEVNVLGVVEHPNLVKLVGYCGEDDERGIQRLLVYEYMPKRSVQDHLSSRFGSTLPWSIRMKVAQDAARGLSYLHEGLDFQIIFRDFKSSNILLDDEWNAKLSDFGLARLGPTEGISHVSTAVVGTIGYAAPEYIQTGRLTSKSDVWSYGVFLYELITGRRPFDRNRPRNEQNLLEWVRPHLSDLKKFSLIVDPRLEGNYYHKTAVKVAAIANRCLTIKAKARPKMSQVLEMINRVLEPTNTPSPTLPFLKTLSPKIALEVSKRERVKRKFVALIVGENGCRRWGIWTPKLVITC